MCWYAQKPPQCGYVFRVQPIFASNVDLTINGNRTDADLELLDQINMVISWSELLVLIAPHAPAALEKARKQA